MGGKDTLFPFLRFFAVLTGFAALIYIIKFSFIYIFPFLLAGIIAYLLQPAVAFLEEKWRIPRPAGTIISLSAFLLVIGSLVFYVVSELLQGTTYLLDKIPDYFHFFVQFSNQLLNETILPLYDKLTSYLNTLTAKQQVTIHEQIMNFLENTVSSSIRYLQDAVTYVPYVASKIPGLLTVAIITFLAAVFISNDWKNIQRHLRNMLPDKIHRPLTDVAGQFIASFAGYMKAQLLLVTISVCIIYAGLLLLDIEHALTIAIIAGIVDIIPLIGTGILFIPWIVYLFFTGDYALTIGICLLYMTVIMQRQLTEPKIISSGIGLPPLVSLIILFFGWQFWGFAGILFSPVLLIAVSSVIRSHILRYIWQFIKEGTA